MITNRWCTNEFKITPIRRYLRDVVGATPKRPVIMDIGFSIDEARRMANASQVRYIYKNYPLVWDHVSRTGCEDIIKRHGWPAAPKSACDFCMFRGPKYFKKMAYENPKRFQEIMELEESTWRVKHFTLLPGISLRELRDKNAGNLDAFATEGTCMEDVCGV